MSLLDHCYCINLDSRPDRWEESVKEFDRVGLNVKRWRAIEASTSTQQEIKKFTTFSKKQNNTAAEVACKKSHLEIIRHAKKHKFPSVTIFEDDVNFIYDDFVERVRRAEFHVPENWILFLYGTTHRTVDPYKNKKFRIVTNFLGAHAYSINFRIYNHILNRERFFNSPFDFCLSNEFCKTRKVFYVFPGLCSQRKSYSNLREIVRQESKNDTSYIGKTKMEKKLFRLINEG